MCGMLRHGLWECSHPNGLYPPQGVNRYEERIKYRAPRLTVFKAHCRSEILLAVWMSGPDQSTPWALVHTTVESADIWST